VSLTFVIASVPLIMLVSSMAGTDTTSTTITYLLWELTRRPDIVKRLQSELDTVMPDGKVLPDISVLHELPFLNAFLKEGNLNCGFAY